MILFASAYSHLMGTLGGGFYLHNISLPIYQNSKRPEKAVRDMFIGFFLVCMSYILCGVLGMYGFKSPYLFPGNGEIQQNCLNQLAPKNPIAIIIRICTFCQLMASCSLIFACQRGNILLVTTGKTTSDDKKKVLTLNILILIGPGILAVVYP